MLCNVVSPQRCDMPFYLSRHTGHVIFEIIRSTTDTIRQSSISVYILLIRWLIYMPKGMVEGDPGSIIPLVFLLTNNMT